MEPSEGLTATIRRVGASVRNVARDDAPDVVQEALARALKCGVSVEAEAWLQTVAKRIAIDGIRRRHEFPSGSSTDIDEMATTHDGNPEAAYLRAERSAEIHRALDTLPPRYRKALLTYMEEESPAGVARKLGLSASATWTLLSRARTHMRLALESSGFTPVVVFARTHWRELTAGAAAAGVAAAAAVVPATFPRSHAPAPAIHATAPTSSAEHASGATTTTIVDPKRAVNIAVQTPHVVQQVVTKAPLHYGVEACLLGLRAPQPTVAVDVWLARGPNPSTVTRLADRVPALLRDRVVGARLCR